jgi:hypothetical protein
MLCSLPLIFAIFLSEAPDTQRPFVLVKQAQCKQDKLGWINGSWQLETCGDYKLFVLSLVIPQQDRYESEVQ